MALTIRRSIEVPFNVPAQLVLGGGLDNGSRWLPHFAPDSWQGGNAVQLIAAQSLTILLNPGGNVGIRLYRIFCNVAAGAAGVTRDGPLYIQFSGGAGVIYSVWYDSAPREHVLDFSPFGLPPANLTSNIELFNAGAGSCFLSWMAQWGREPVAIQNE